MKALVLTYDRNAILTDHMMLRYAQLWPDHPFEFMIPYQDRAVQNDANKTYIRSPVAIVETVLHLLDKIPDDEWIYWSMDDWYPVQLDVARIKRICALLEGDKLGDVSGINFCITNSKARRKRKHKIRHNQDTRIIGGFRSTEIFDYGQIWFHQFIRAKALRHMFENIRKPDKDAKEMDKSKEDVVKPRHHRLFLLSEDLARFGESTRYKSVTVNCFKSLVVTGLIPKGALAPTSLAKYKVQGRMGLKWKVIWVFQGAWLEIKFRIWQLRTL